jgi:hypothetical protein
MGTIHRLASLWHRPRGGGGGSGSGKTSAPSSPSSSADSGGGAVAEHAKFSSEWWREPIPWQG